MRNGPQRLHPRGRPSPPPPPLTRSPGDDPLPHSVVLEEHEPASAVVLWQLLHDVMLWASMPPEQRGSGLFNDAPVDVRDVVPELDLDLATLSVLVRDEHPDSGPVIASICARVAEWAERNGRTGTALEFMQAAALTDRRSPRYAHRLAKLARARADYGRATVWFARAIALSRRAGEWETLARSYGGLGKLHRQLGNLARALGLQERSRRIARCHGLREARADALADLSVLRYETGDTRLGLAAARDSLRAYGPRHEKVARLAHDTAVCWMDHQGEFGQALAVLRELLPRHWMPADRILLVANLARGAAHLGDTQRAELAARQAISTAVEGRESLARSEAESVLSEVGSERSVREPSDIAEAPSAAVPETEKLAGDFVSALGKSRRVEDDETRALTAVLESPADPRAAYRLARLAKGKAEYERAEAWFQRAIVLGERAGDWEASARSLGGLGNLRRQRGNHPAAAEVHQHALAVARAHGLSELTGDALLDLCVLRFEMGDGNSGFQLAREAIETYGPRHPRIPKIAHDVGVYLMEQRGDHVNALTVFRELANCTFRPADLLLLHGNTARAAAGSGEMHVFEEAWDAAGVLMKRLRTDEENFAPALVALAHAALIAGRPDWADVAAARAREVAGARQEARHLYSAEQVAQMVARARKTRVRPRPYTDPNHDTGAANALSREIVRALRACAPPSRGSAHPAGERTETASGWLGGS
jgi:tetratricopeptide (TPR) repeat protein